MILFKVILILMFSSLVLYIVIGMTKRAMYNYKCGTCSSKNLRGPTGFDR